MADANLADRSAERRDQTTTLHGAVLHLWQWSKMMICKTYIGIPHREAPSGQPTGEPDAA